MTHLHRRSGQTFEVGSYISPNDNRMYDMTIITYWKDPETEDIGSPVVLVGYYFGDYSAADTDYYIDRWLENRAKEISVLQTTNRYLDAYLVTNRDVLDEPVIQQLSQALVECNELLEDRSWIFEFKDPLDIKMKRSDYLRFIKRLHEDGKVDCDALDALTRLAINYED